jgi:hypothetical protein
MGSNQMDPGTRIPAARAGFAQGEQEATPTVTSRPASSPKPGPTDTNQCPHNNLSTYRGPLRISDVGEDSSLRLPPVLDQTKRLSG